MVEKIEGYMFVWNKFELLVCWNQANKLVYLGSNREDFEKLFATRKFCLTIVNQRPKLKCLGWIEAYFKQEPFVIALDEIKFYGTEFQIKVWKSLLSVNYNTTKTYQQFSAAMGLITSTRAVASAIGKNPITILLACHRIVGVKQTYQYRLGSNMKKALIDFEKSDKKLPKLIW